MARSYGANASLCALKESAYGVKPIGNFERFTFLSVDLSAEQSLIAAELLGSGREPSTPFRDVIKDSGNLSVPVDTRAFGRWLQFLLGNPHSSELEDKEDLWEHSFESGAVTLPSFALEIGHSQVPAYFLHTGCMLNSMELKFERSGIATANLNIMAQGEVMHKASQAGTPTSKPFKPFSQFSGYILRNSQRIGNVISSSFVYANGMEAIETIRNDGLIDGVDPSGISITGTIEIRFADNTLLDDACKGEPIELELGYSVDEFALTWKFHEVYLHKPRIPISGPGGVQVSFNWQAAYHHKLKKSATVILKNDISSY